MPKVEITKDYAKSQSPLISFWSTWGLRILLVVTVGCLFLTVKLFLSPQMTEEKVVINKVRQYADFSSSAIIRPSALYPQGGDTGVRKKFFTNIVNTLNIRIISRLAAEKPVSLTGDAAVLLTLKADDLWEKEFILQPKKEFTFSQKTDFTVVNGLFPVNIHQIIGFIDQVEKEIKSSPAEYSLLINPVIKGTSPDKRVKVYYSPVYTVKFSKIQIKTDGHANDEKELLIEEITKKDTSTGVYGISIPVRFAKFMFLALFLLLLTATFLLVKRTIANHCLVGSETEILHKKYGSRIVKGSVAGVGSNSISIKLSTFQELIKLADEHEKPVIFDPKVRSENGLSSAYVVIDGSVVYMYEPA